MQIPQKKDAFGWNKTLTHTALYGVKYNVRDDVGCIIGKQTCV